MTPASLLSAHATLTLQTAALGRIIDHCGDEILTDPRPVPRLESARVAVFACECGHADAAVQAAGLEAIQAAELGEVLALVSSSPVPSRLLICWEAARASTSVYYVIAMARLVGVRVGIITGPAEPVAMPDGVDMLPPDRRVLARWLREPIIMPRAYAMHGESPPRTTSR